MELLRWMVLFSLFILSLIILWYEISLLRSVIAGAPYVNSSRNVAEQMVLLAAIKPNEKVYDLGSGSGQLILAAGQAGAIVTGIEINSFAVLISRFRLRRARVNGRVMHSSFWKHSLQEADVVFVYLFPGLVERVKQKLISELKPGARVISRGFPFTGWQPTKTEGRLYLYTVLPKNKPKKV